MNKGKSRAKDVKDLKFPEDFLNIKCVIYTLIIAILYWFLPRTRLSIVSASILSFFSINWYNYVYSNNNLIFNIIYAITIGLLLTYLPLK